MIQHISVNPERRREGFASAAIRDIEALAKKKQYGVYIQSVFYIQSVLTNDMTKLCIKLGYERTNCGGFVKNLI